MRKLNLPQQIRRLAALVQTGQPWDQGLPEEVAQQYQAWLQAASASNQPQLLLIRLASYCEEVERTRTEAARLLNYPRLVLAQLSLLLVGLELGLLCLPSSPLALGVLFVLLLVAGGSWAASRDPNLAWQWLGQGGRGRFEQVLWCGHLAQLLDLELDLPQASHWAARTVRDPEVRGQALALEERLRSGDTLAQALEPCHWDPLIGWACEAAADHASLAQALSEASRTLEENLKEDIAVTLAWLQPAALTLVGLLVLATLGTFLINYQVLCLEAAT
jgi:type II secretory pathway component PulF